MTAGLLLLIAASTASAISEILFTLNPFAPYISATLSKDGPAMSAPKYLFPYKSFWY